VARRPGGEVTSCVYQRTSGRNPSWPVAFESGQEANSPRSTADNYGQPRSTWTAWDKCRTIERGTKPPVAYAPGSPTLTVPAHPRNAIRPPRKSPWTITVWNRHPKLPENWRMAKKACPCLLSCFLHNVHSSPFLHFSTVTNSLCRSESGLTKKDICFSLSTPVS
jgi:hypothetical protein